MKKNTLRQQISDILWEAKLAYTKRQWEKQIDKIEALIND